MATYRGACSADRPAVGPLASSCLHRTHRVADPAAEVAVAGAGSCHHCCPITGTTMAVAKKAADAEATGHWRRPCAAEAPLCQPCDLVGAAIPSSLEKQAITTGSSIT